MMYKPYKLLYYYILCIYLLHIMFSQNRYKNVSLQWTLSLTPFSDVSSIWSFSTSTLSVSDVYVCSLIWTLGPVMALPDIIEAFSSQTSMHGVPKAINAKSKMARAFWSIVCITATSMFVLQVSITIHNHLYDRNYFIRIDATSHFHNRRISSKSLF